MGNDKQIRILKQFLCIFAILFDTYFFMLFLLYYFWDLTTAFNKQLLLQTYNYTRPQSNKALKGTD